MQPWSVGFCAACVFAAVGSAKAGMLPGEQFHWNFRVDVTSGPLEGGSFLGDFGYTLTEPVRGGGPPDLLLDFLNFNFVGQPFTEQDDVDFPDFPRARFANPSGEFLGIDLIVLFSIPQRGEGNATFSVFEDRFAYDLDLFDRPSESARGGFDSTSGIGTVTYELIPAPGAALILGVSAWFGLRRRRD